MIVLFKSREVSKKPFFNENRKKAHLVRSFHSLMVFKESVF
ncbi:hypothetical protein HPCPY1962_1436 [Helicobacter pylori CPY1962]|nr:hypothetical protein HPCPY1962_1436 [Helicobacter pylori CPY1962]